jgi:hypothetical protein
VAQCSAPATGVGPHVLARDLVGPDAEHRSALAAGLARDAIDRGTTSTRVDPFSVADQLFAGGARPQAATTIRAAGISWSSRELATASAHVQGVFVDLAVAVVVVSVARFGLFGADQRMAVVAIASDGGGVGRLESASFSRGALDANPIPVGVEVVSTRLRCAGALGRTASARPSAVTASSAGATHRKLDTAGVARRARARDSVSICVEAVRLTVSIFGRVSAAAIAVVGIVGRTIAIAGRATRLCFVLGAAERNSAAEERRDAKSK